MTILSIDSGLERTGFAIFDRASKHANGFKYIDSGLVHTPKTWSKENRLKSIHDQMERIIEKHKPKVMILEQLFFFKNVKTAISVAQAQGVVLLLAAKYSVPTHYLTPLQIKQIITGYGQADKKSVQKMLKLTLGLNGELKQDDVADAIACGAAFCYQNQQLQ